MSRSIAIQHDSHYNQYYLEIPLSSNDSPTKPELLIDQELDVHGTTIGNFRASVLKYPNSPFVSFRAGLSTSHKLLTNEYRSLTYKEGSNIIDRIAVMLAYCGVVPHAKVGILAANSPLWLLSDLAISAVGGITVPINQSFSFEELIFCINHSGVKIILAQAQYIPLLLGISHRCLRLKLIVSFDDVPDDTELLTNAVNIFSQVENYLFADEVPASDSSENSVDNSLFENVIGSRRGSLARGLALGTGSRRSSFGAGGGRKSESASPDDLCSAILAQPIVAHFNSNSNQITELPDNVDRNVEKLLMIKSGFNDLQRQAPTPILSLKVHSVLHPKKVGRSTLLELRDMVTYMRIKTSNLALARDCLVNDELEDLSPVSDSEDDVSVDSHNALTSSSRPEALSDTTDDLLLPDAYDPRDLESMGPMHIPHSAEPTVSSSSGHDAQSMPCRARRDAVPPLQAQRKSSPGSPGGSGGSKSSRGHIVLPTGERVSLRKMRRITAINDSLIILKMDQILEITKHIPYSADAAERRTQCYDVNSIIYTNVCHGGGYTFDYARRALGDSRAATLAGGVRSLGADAAGAAGDAAGPVDRRLRLNFVEDIFNTSFLSRGDDAPALYGALANSSLSSAASAPVAATALLPPASALGAALAAAQPAADGFRQGEGEGGGPARTPLLSAPSSTDTAIGVGAVGAVPGARAEAGLASAAAPAASAGAGAGTDARSAQQSFDSLLAETYGVTDVRAYPAAVVLTHENFLTAATGICYKRLPYASSLAGRRQSTLFSYISMAVPYQRAVEHAAYARGYRICYYSGDTDAIFRDMRLCSPTVFVAVPKFYTSVFNSVFAAITRAGLSSKKSFEKALASRMHRIQNVFGLMLKKDEILYRLESRELDANTARLGFSSTTFHSRRSSKGAPYAVELLAQDDSDQQSPYGQLSAKRYGGVVAVVKANHIRMLSTKLSVGQTASRTDADTEVEPAGYAEARADVPAPAPSPAGGAGAQGAGAGTAPVHMLSDIPEERPAAPGAAFGAASGSALGVQGALDSPECIDANSATTAAAATAAGTVPAPAPALAQAQTRPQPRGQPRAGAQEGSRLKQNGSAECLRLEGSHVTSSDTEELPPSHTFDRELGNLKVAVPVGKWGGAPGAGSAGAGPRRHRKEPPVEGSQKTILVRTHKTTGIIEVELTPKMLDRGADGVRPPGGKQVIDLTNPAEHASESLRRSIESHFGVQAGQAHAQGALDAPGGPGAPDAHAIKAMQGDLRRFAKEVKHQERERIREQKELAQLSKELRRLDVSKDLHSLLSLPGDSAHFQRLQDMFGGALEYLMCFTEGLKEGVWDFFRCALNCYFSTGYGFAECGGAGLYSECHDRVKYNSIGRSNPLMACKLVDLSHGMFLNDFCQMLSEKLRHLFQLDALRARLREIERATVCAYLDALGAGISAGAGASAGADAESPAAPQGAEAGTGAQPATLYRVHFTMKVRAFLDRVAHVAHYKRLKGRFRFVLPSLNRDLMGELCLWSRATSVGHYQGEFDRLSQKGKIAQTRFYYQLRLNSPDLSFNNPANQTVAEITKNTLLNLITKQSTLAGASGSAQRRTEAAEQLRTNMRELQKTVGGSVLGMGALSLSGTDGLLQRQSSRPKVEQAGAGTGEAADAGGSVPKSARGRADKDKDRDRDRDAVAAQPSPDPSASQGADPPSEHSEHRGMTIENNPSLNRRLELSMFKPGAQTYTSPLSATASGQSKRLSLSLAGSSAGAGAGSAGLQGSLSFCDYASPRAPLSVSCGVRLKADQPAHPDDSPTVEGSGPSEPYGALAAPTAQASRGAESSVSGRSDCGPTPPRRLDRVQTLPSPSTRRPQTPETRDPRDQRARRRAELALDPAKIMPFVDSLGYYHTGELVQFNTADGRCTYVGRVNKVLEESCSDAIYDIINELRDVVLEFIEELRRDQRDYVEAVSGLPGHTAGRVEHPEGPGGPEGAEHAGRGQAHDAPEAAPHSLLHGSPHSLLHIPPRSGRDAKSPLSSSARPGVRGHPKLPSAAQGTPQHVVPADGAADAQRDRGAVCDENDVLIPMSPATQYAYREEFLGLLTSSDYMKILHIKQRGTRRRPAAVSTASTASAAAGAGVGAHPLGPALSAVAGHASDTLAVQKARKGSGLARNASAALHLSLQELSTDTPYNALDAQAHPAAAAGYVKRYDVLIPEVLYLRNVPLQQALQNGKYLNVTLFEEILETLTYVKSAFVHTDYYQHPFVFLSVDGGRLLEKLIEVDLLSAIDFYGPGAAGGLGDAAARMVTNALSLNPLAVGSLRAHVLHNAAGGVIGQAALSARDEEKLTCFLEPSRATWDSMSQADRGRINSFILSEIRYLLHYMRLPRSFAPSYTVFALGYPFEESGLFFSSTLKKRRPMFLRVFAQDIEQYCQTEKSAPPSFDSSPYHPYLKQALSPQ